MNNVALLLDTNSIDVIRIVHAPPAEHPFRITLDSLIAGGPYSLELSGTGLELHSHKLAEAFRSADVSSSKWSGEVTWALVLQDRAGNEVIRIGFDESGQNGYVGKDAVRMKGTGVATWARKALPE